MDERTEQTTGRIGVIGLGAMGKPIAHNILRAGFDVAVTWHRNKEPARELESAGATILHPLQNLAEHCEIVITVLPGDRELEQVYLGKQGLLNQMAPNGCCIDLTTARPSTIQQLATAAGHAFDIVDAPVSGGVTKAKAGTLTAIVGAEEKALYRVRTILDAICGPVYHVGNVGTGKAMKMINQLLVAGNTYLACEALALAEDSNLDLEMVSTVISHSSGVSWAFENAIKRSVLTGNYDGGFPLRLMKKDLEIAGAAARELQLPLQLTETLLRVYRNAATPERLEAYFPILYKWLHEQ